MVCALLVLLVVVARVVELARVWRGARPWPLFVDLLVLVLLLAVAVVVS